MNICEPSFLTAVQSGHQSRGWYWPPEISHTRLENDTSEWQFFTNTRGSCIAVCACMSECMDVQPCACMCLYVRVYLEMCVHVCACKCVCVCLHASRQISLSSIISIVCLVVHDQSVLDEIEAVWSGLERALHHLTDWKANTCMSSVPAKTLIYPSN